VTDIVLHRLNAALAERYVAEREIGRGGMATVYLARDLRHDRSVALKIVHPDLGAVLGTERFLTEIRVTANLQHPTILPLFDSGRAEGQNGSDSTLYYVMPYVEGESLRQRLDRDGPLDVAIALQIAITIADALDYAHRHGVIHRDLKPESILLHASETGRGSTAAVHPVVADFGLALAVSSAGGERLTQTGLSLGTPQYMSPEQATGDRRVDARSDIYSLGAVLYEMLAGEPPHTGPSVQAVFAKLLTERPRSLRLARDTVPQHVDAAVERALAKLPADRFSTAREFAEALESSASPKAIAPARPRSRAVATAAVLGGVALFAGGFALHPSRAKTSDAVTSRFVVPLSGDERLTARNEGSYLAISPDGKRVVYVARAGLSTRLVVRALDELVPRPLAGTEDATSPAVSPDGRWVAFFVGTKLRKMPIDGGPITDIADVTQTDFPSLAWPLDTLLVLGGTGESAGLSAVNASGGRVRTLTKPANAVQHVMPVAIPGGREVLFTNWGPGDSRDDYIGVASLEDGSFTLTPLIGAAAVGIIDGQLLYTRSDGVVMAVPYDARGHKVTGEPVAVLDGVKPGAWPGAPVIASNGTAAYVTGGVRNTIVIADRSGTRPLLDEPRAYTHPRLSPDGRHLALQIESPIGTAIWNYDIATHTLGRLTPELYNTRPEWSPDGTRVLCYSLMNSRRGLGWVPADGSGGITPLVLGPEVEGTISRDGKSLLYRNDDGRGHMEVGAMRLGDTTRTVLIADGARNLSPRLSPDGRLMAYASDQSGQFEVYVRPFRDGGGRVQISVGGGSEPVWARDGTRLYYRQGRAFIVATLSGGDVPSVVRRETLLENDFLTDSEHADYDVTADGNAIVGLAPAEEMRLTIVVNWPDEIRRRLAARGP